MTLLFQAIKERSPDVQVHTLMTDDGKYQNFNTRLLCATYVHVFIFQDEIWCNGGETVFGTELRHLLCHWHVDRYIMYIHICAESIRKHTHDFL